MSQTEKSSYEYYDETASVMGPPTTDDQSLQPQRPPLPIPPQSNDEMVEASDASEYESFEESLEESMQPPPKALGGPEPTKPQPAPVAAP